MTVSFPYMYGLNLLLTACVASYYVSPFTNSVEHRTNITYVRIERQYLSQHWPDNLKPLKHGQQRSRERGALARPRTALIGNLTLE